MRLRMKHLNFKFVLLVLAATALLVTPLTGCKSNKLEPGGAYAPSTPVVTDGVTNWVATAAPDPIFYSTDVAFDFAYTIVDTAFKFEKDNRQLLWSLSPEIKQTLDKLRPQAAAVVTAYTTARAKYLQNPTPAGLSQLSTLLSQIQNLSAAAQAALPASNR